MDTYETTYLTQETPEIMALSKNDKSDIKDLETRSYSLSLSDEEFELTMNLREEFLEFKLKQKDIISNCYYKSNFSLQKLNKLLFKSFKEIKEVFIFCDKMIN